jgi:hypothetical protein
MLSVKSSTTILCKLFELPGNPDIDTDKKKYMFFNLGQICIILSLLAYGQCRLAMIFDFELSHQKKVVSDLFEVHLNVSK